MILLGKKVLDDFKKAHADARSSIESWETEAGNAQWKTSHEIKSQYPKASIIGGKNVVFDICGNKYRLWVLVAYKTATVFIKNIGNHAEYEKWDIK